MAFSESFSISFSRHLVKISAFSDWTMANCSNILKWNVGPMSLLSWNHCSPKENYCHLFIFICSSFKSIYDVILPVDVRRPLPSQGSSISYDIPFSMCAVLGKIICEYLLIILSQNFLCKRHMIIFNLINIYFLLSYL